MRRSPIVLTGTAAGVAAVLLFHPRTPESPVVAAVAATTPASTAPGTTATTPSAPSTGSGSGSAAGGSSSSSSGTQVLTGKAIATRYGNAQVQVTIKAGKITDVKALQLQGNEPKSVQISGTAAPILRQEALEKQSAAIDAVSGATITSASYEASLQSALDQAGFKAADGSRGTTTVPNIPEEDHGGFGDGDGGRGPGDGGPPSGGFVPGGAPPDGSGSAAPQVTPQTSGGDGELPTS